ncbi:MAG: LCP family protein [Maledivibacter sp.]|jgi:LCP family protein required for cell wall assembly|nr:LCP family protein [Maledivibacter sp.]
MILSILTLYSPLNVNALTSDYIEIVDSAIYPQFIDISVITSDNISERIRCDNRKLKETNKYAGKKENKDTNEEKIEHILLVGIDSRSNTFSHSRADTIMIASINKFKRQVKLTSIMRDTYVKIPRHKNNRINAAYAYGGVELLKETINKNFNLNIDKHIVINFKGFERVIDVLGGVDVNIKKYEVRELNRCLSGLGRSRQCFIKQSGLKHVNGQQALAYCRIRKVGKGDYERTERQQRIMKLIIDKVKELNFSEYPKLIAGIYPNVKTNISNKESLKLVYDYYKINDWNMESIQIPTNKSGKPRIINSMWVIDPNINECIKCIKEFIY